jgi:hypothetical protein
MIRQQKMAASGETRTWDLDIEAMSGCASWSQSRPDLLGREVELLTEAFPTLLAAVGVPVSTCWVDAAEPLTCPECKDLIVFDRGTRCATCQQPVTPPDETVVGFVGRLPALISARPFAVALKRRMAEMRSRQDPRHELFERSVFEAGGRQYLAPRFGLWFAQSWPHDDPPVMVWPEYFEVLDIPPDHIYVADPYYRLCLYARWREQPARDVLQRRAVPRLLIDLMVADLVALGKLDLALEQLDASLYEVYNMVGDAEAGAPFRRVYNDIVGS